MSASQNDELSNNDQPPEKIRSKKLKNRKKLKSKFKYKPKLNGDRTWQDYLEFYNGNESLAQLHFECMEAYKNVVIQECVKREYQRIIQLRSHSETESEPKLNKQPRKKRKLDDIEQKSDIIKQTDHDEQSSSDESSAGIADF